MNTCNPVLHKRVIDNLPFVTFSKYSWNELASKLSATVKKFGEDGKQVSLISAHVF